MYTQYSGSETNSLPEYTLGWTIKGEDKMINAWFTWPHDVIKQEHRANPRLVIEWDSEQKPCIFIGMAHGDDGMIDAQQFNLTRTRETDGCGGTCSPTLHMWNDMTSIQILLIVIVI